MPSEQLHLILHRLATAVIVVLGGVAVLLFVAGDRIQKLTEPGLDPIEEFAEPNDLDDPAEAEGFEPIYGVEEKAAITGVTTIPASEVGDEIEDDELLIGVVIDGSPRAYVIDTLTGPDREVLNDTLAGQPIAATW